jgi:hypothetical protein
MEPDVLKTNILAIAGAGLLIFLTGIGLYLFKNDLSKNIRFLLPILPLGVAAYVFVFNLNVYYGEEIAQKSWHIAKDIALSTAISALVYGAFTVVLVIFIDFVRRLF